MRKVIAASIGMLAIFASIPALAQSLYIYPATAIAPRGTYQTVTAIVNGVNNKTVTWSVNNGATLVGANPCVVNEPCTIAVYDTTVETDTLTATSNANGSVVGTSTITFTPSPTPVTTHPRFLITSATLPALQAKTTPGNLPYQSIRNQAIAAYNTDNALWSWSCNGGTGQPSTPQYEVGKEDDAQLFAEMALLDPSDATYKWGCYGHDVWMYIMTGYATGAEDPGGNPWSDASGAYALTTDWLIGAGALNAAEQAAIRGDLYILAQGVVLNSHGNGYSTPHTLSKYNSSALFNQGIAQGPTSDIQNQRSMGNNYSFSRILILAAIGLTFNDTTDDDPPLANTCSATRYQLCPDGTAGSLHAYWNYVDGSMLYLMNAHLEDPTVGWKEYQAAYGNLPTQPTCLYGEGPAWPCFGDGRDGESSEGAWYSYSFVRLRYMLNLLHTAGMDDPILYGPQISLATSSWWDLKYVEDAEFLTSMALNNGGIGGGQPLFSYLQTGDSYTYGRIPNDMITEASMMTFDSYTGRTDRTNALKWLILNVAVGGPLGTYPGCVYDCGFDANLANPYIGGNNALDLFIAMPAGDPVATLPADPRPSMPTDLYAGSFNQHVMVRDGWSSPTLFSAYAPNTLINHELQWAGRFDIFANGEYITKGRTVFDDYNYFTSASPQSNILSIDNQLDPSFGATACNSTSMNCGFVTWAAVQGGQFWQGDQAGFVPLLHSELPAYSAFIVNTVNVYNGIPFWTNVPIYDYVTGASRSIIYLRGSNQVALYDRGATSNGLGMSVSQITTGPPTISGDTASWLTRSSSQKAYLTNLLPSGATVVNSGLPCQACTTDETSDWEPYAELAITAPGTPVSTQFLSVLEWGPSSLTQSPTTLVQSSSGQNFDGTLIGSSLVMFMRNWPAAFTGMTYPASGATTHYISDLTPNTTYTVSGAGVPSTVTTDTAGVATFSATGTGNITITTGGASPYLTSITVAPSVTTLPALGTQQFAATCNYSDGSSANCTSGAAWASSSMGVATINSSGMATGVAQGSANIIATSGSVQGQAAITVSAPTLQSIAVTPGTQMVPIGGVQQFKATGNYSDSSTRDLTATAVWSSSNAAVAAASSAGVATAMAAGRANIMAASGGVQGLATVTVPAATPTFSPAAGSYTSTQTVTIGTATPSATIYYTTNGTTPTTSSPVYSGPITVSATETLSAIAIATGNSSSAVGSAAYTITPPAATPSFSPGAGTYSSTQTVTISTAAPSATIYYTTNGTTPTTSSPVYSGPITVSSTETLSAIAVATGDSSSAVGSAAYTITPPAATPSFSPAAGTYTSTQTVAISTATPSAAIYYTTNGTTPTTSSPVYSGPITVSATETLSAIAVATGDSSSAVGSAAYTITPPATTPSFSPVAGTYTSTQTVTISTVTPSATIYYTTNGTTPTTNSPVYSGPITISATETLTAIAMATGNSSSAVGSAAYTIAPPAATPSFSPAAGTYTSTQSVAIGTATPSATIYYTTNGTTPTTSSPVYSGPITVSTSETLAAIAVATGNSSSAVGSAAYTITPPAAMPSFSPVAGTYTSTQTVTIGTATPSATIYYTTNGTTPTTSSPVYSGPITISATETLAAIAVATGNSSSAVGSATYTIDLSQASAPTFSLAPGTYTSSQVVTLSVTAPLPTVSYSVNALIGPLSTIYYTTDGSIPTTNSPVYSGPIAIDATETIRAIAVVTGHSTSSVSSAIYTITSPAAAPVFSPAPGTYTSAQTVTIGTATPSATIYYTTNGTVPTTGSAVYFGPITVSASETVQAIAVASGYSTSAASSAAYTIKLPRTSTPIFSPAAGVYASAQTVTISTSVPSTIFYTTNGSRPTSSSPVYSGPIAVAATETVKAIAIASGDSTSAEGSAAYVIVPPQAATPTFSPASGAYASSQQVTIGSTTPAATFYYTTDGSRPTSRSPIYSGPIAVATTETVRAIAVARGYSTSTEGSAEYEIVTPAATPTFSPAAGTYGSAQRVTIGTTTPSTTIHYTVNGTTPTTASPVYSGPITVAATATIKAIAVPVDASNTKTAPLLVSPVSSAVYTIKGPAPSFSIALFPSSITVVGGHSGTASVQVTPQNGYASTVSFSCSGLPAGASCSFSPASVAPAGDTASTTLTIATSTATAALPRNSGPMVPGTSFVAVFCCFGWKKRRGLRLLSAGLAAALGLGLCTGCGADSISPILTSTVSVVATDGSLQPTASFTLTVL